MSVYKPKGKPHYLYDFQIGGNRFHGTTGKGSKAEARAVEDATRKRAQAQIEAARTAKDAPLTLDLAVGRYWTEAGQHRSNAGDLWRDLGRLVDYFGKDRLLSDITDDDVAKLVAWRRGHRVARQRKHNTTVENPLISPSTVNRSTTEVLQRVFTRARRLWKVRLENEPTWHLHMLAEPRERIRELRHDEDMALSAALDPDYESLRRFSLASGLRMRESLLRWSQVDFAAGVIVTVGKGDEPIRLPMTATMRTILQSRTGHHADWVFTYAAKRARDGRGRDLRYPITASGLKTHWRRRKAKAGVSDYRWHDNRHTFATGLLRTTGNLKLVQRGLNHRKIETTAKYAHVLDHELRAGMEAADRNRAGDAETHVKVPTKVPTEIG
jgi:site-specific recombinase XerD